MNVNCHAIISFTQDSPGISSSALSYSVSCRLSSASTIHTHSRMHPRLPSAVTNGTLQTLTSIPSVIDTSARSMHSSTTVALPSPVRHEDDQHRQEIHSRTSHAYQIPQLSNVGSESVFVSDSSAAGVNASSSSSIKVRPPAHGTGLSTRKKNHISCPFYVMYFTNLAMQQRRNGNLSEPESSSPSTARKSSTDSYRRHPIIHRQAHRPPNVKEDENGTVNGSAYEQNKRFSAKIAAFENENSHLLKDILRTTSWNHVQV